MKILSLTLILTLIISSCSTFAPRDFANRLPASQTDDISYYLSIDKFKYYINEYSVALEGKVPDGIIEDLRAITIQDIIKMKLSSADLEDSNNYDGIIYDYLKNKGLTEGVKKEDLKWNYNFFRTKLNEAFTITPSKLDMALSVTGGEKATEREIPVEKALYQVEEMTLDSGHYISNRTTRAIFWEAIENDRTIEFHLGDSREFLKGLKAAGGEILYEVRPLAKNYNKIFIVKYPGESSYRYAITNIGGKDRLNHLTNQLSLSNLSGGKLKTKVVIKGDVEKFHAARAEEHIMQLAQLPRADRVIIGQKESIDGKFNIFWKMKALKQLYEEDPSEFKSVDKKTMDKFLAMEDGSLENIFKDKKIVEDLYASVEQYFTDNPEKAPFKFKTYNFDNFTIEMCDYVFTGKDGKAVRWRVVSNVWGDEIVPIARAFKATGHTNLTYMGTAGAFANKGYKVGDLVIPNAVVDANKKIGVQANWMKIEGAKYGGAVEHVGSPFEETEKWLATASARSEFVEVETSYLRQIFNGPNDNVEMYLLVSDILGSDTETLAHATSGKRKNSQNKLLAKLFERDTGSGKIPSPLKIKPQSADEVLKALIDDVLAKKGIAYRYMIFSKLRGQKNVTAEMVEALAEKEATFTDSFAIDKLVKASEVLTYFRDKTGLEFEVGFNPGLVGGTWNAKTEKLELVVLTKSDSDVAKLAKIKEALQASNPELFKALSLDFNNVLPSGMMKSKLPQRVDPDVLLKIYTFAGFKNAGMYKSITYNGSVTFGSLPIKEFTSPSSVFEYIAPSAQKTSKIISSATSGSSCGEAIQAFLRIMN